MAMAQVEPFLLFQERRTRVYAHAATEPCFWVYVLFRFPLATARTKQVGMVGYGHGDLGRNEYYDDFQLKYLAKAIGLGGST